MSFLRYSTKVIENWFEEVAIKDQRLLRNPAMEQKILDMMPQRTHSIIYTSHFRVFFSTARCCCSEMARLWISKGKMDGCKRGMHWKGPQKSLFYKSNMNEYYTIFCRSDFATRISNFNACTHVWTLKSVCISTIYWRALSVYIQKLVHSCQQTL